MKVPISLNDLLKYNSSELDFIVASLLKQSLDGLNKPSKILYSPKIPLLFYSEKHSIEFYMELQKIWGSL